MCTAVDRVFPGYRINGLRAILEKISQARAAGRSRRVRQAPAQVHTASPALLVLAAAPRLRLAGPTPCDGYARWRGYESGAGTEPARRSGSADEGSA